MKKWFVPFLLCLLADVCNFVPYVQVLDEELERELEDDDEEGEVEYIEADSDLEAELVDSETDMEDMHPQQSSKHTARVLKQKQKVEVEYESEVALPSHSKLKR